MRFGKKRKTSPMTSKNSPTQPRLGRPPVDSNEELGAVIGFRCHTAEKVYLQEQARQAGLKPGPYCRRRALGLPLSPARLPLDPKKLDQLIEAIESEQAPAITGTVSRVPPGLLHELSRLSIKLSNVGNLANQLAREMHTDRSFSHDWGEVRDGLLETKTELAEVIAKVGAAFDD